VSQNIYDDPGFQAAYRLLPRSEHGLGGAAEWPVVDSMLPDLSGRDVVDLGCGYGAFARWAAERGAARVDAYDLSEEMLARARELTPGDSVVDYRRADLAELALPEASYDLAYSALVLHYLPDLSRFVETVHASLRPEGAFVFTTEHPVYTAPSEPRWIDDHGGRVWPLDRYADEGERVRDWLAPGVRKYHRMLGTNLTTLLEAGFLLDRVVDWSPTSAQIEADPDLAEEADRPMFLLVAAHR
jgi:SAM-dependent methyltransferase